VRRHRRQLVAASRRATDMWRTCAVSPSSSSLLSQLLPLISLLIQCGCGLAAADRGAFYTDRWAVQVQGGEDVARRLAADHGFEFIAKVSWSFYY